MNTVTPAGWHDYEDLPKRLQMEAKLARPRWGISDFSRFQFRVKPDGHISCRLGEHQLTKAASAIMDEELELNFRPARADKGDIHHLKTTQFGLNREPVG
jgi:hypothetical protein